ncbi:translation initiation factor IF-2 [Ancylothrix sp. C2]|uniref:translation initiation factor IF-2 n=1 Tax=Ancylothrix sp. D3o TaxID=2953691 RepID=UPI0021BB6168|nr:translation initiation factor IF-2 [Ancylothrix sp. D3o]MCT7951015.1 translation initiation factor IF-2 [Ancylothrix sp. D3o]
MNNGKVRIYDLSRELNLDNKDILAFCEHLNIAFKSHSSTITEAEAERIRAHAEKHPVPHPHADFNKPAAARQPNKPRSEHHAETSAERPSERKKQEILEIRTHSPRPAQTAPTMTIEQTTRTESGSNSSQVLVSPTASTSQRVQQPEKPKMLNRPSRQDQSEEATQTPTGEPTEAMSAPEEFAETASGGDNFSPPEAKKTSSPPEATSQGRTARQTREGGGQERPKLTTPPVRPNNSKDPGSTGVRPVLKQRQKPGSPEEVAELEIAEQTSQQPAAAAPAPAVGVGANADKPKRIAVRPSSTGAPTRSRSSAGGASTPGEAILPRPQLIRPNAPGGELDQKPKGSEGSEEGEGTDGEVALLVRPNPPRQPKKGKKREAEEEVVEDFSDKGKAGTKAKRRTKPIEEDDDDLDGDLEDLPETVQVSLSIARPAKQKAPMRAKPAISTAAAPSKAKKAAAVGEASSNKNNRQKGREQQGKPQRPEKIVLSGSINVRELANLLGVAETEIVKTLFFKGMAVNVTQTLDQETATVVAQELGTEVETGIEESEARKSTQMVGAEEKNLHLRPPVVTVMGHVDHGKTTLLDTIRKTKVAAGEAGGITQHIGAYHVDVEHNGRTQQVVFLDTPGHEAFTAMRARGARVTDIAILVVAADDGVRPQTIEAIGHAKAAEVPIVVAINKIDKEGASPDRVKQELTEYGLLAEEWGGDTIMVPVSAIRGENLDTLLEMILLVAEVQELQANPDRAAKGTVIEAHLDKARGPVATLLVQNGTLRVGDILVAGSTMGKVRAMIDDAGSRVEAASPSFAVEVLGLGEVPAAGDEFEVFQNEREARAVADARFDENRQSRLQQAMSSRRVSLSALSQQAKEGQLKELNLILKADVQGSVEAILGSLQQLPQNEVQVRVLLSAPGEITETDVDLAAASGAVIVGFSTTFASGARQAADALGVDVRDYNIIYNLLDDIQGAMEGLLEPELVEEGLGTVEVRAVFPISKGAVAGCYVLSGKIIRNCKVRVRRNGNVIYEGVLDSLRRMKEDVKEVNAGFECGISLDKFQTWAEGDIIEAFRMVTKRRTLSPN